MPLDHPAPPATKRNEFMSIRYPPPEGWHSGLKGVDACVSADGGETWSSIGLARPAWAEALFARLDAVVADRDRYRAYLQSIREVSMEDDTLQIVTAALAPPTPAAQESKGE